MKKEKIKILILIVVFIIVVVCITLFTLLASQKKEVEMQEVIVNGVDLTYVQGPLQKNIEDLRDNSIEYINVTDKEIAEKYILNYINLVVYDTEKSYALLDNQYKNTRFPTFEEYNQYIKTVKQYLLNAKIQKVDAIGEYNSKEYVCKDNYGNTYIIKETGVMEYTIQLDSYTLENEVFNKKYAEAKDVDKCVMNLQKFLEMINMQDYESAYSVLDETFRQNNFGTVDNFANYMRNNFFRYNVLAGKEHLNDIADLYTYRLVVKDGTGENQNKLQFNAVMRLLDGKNFVMSFGV